MSVRPALGLGRRLALRGLHAASRLLAGYAAPLVDEVVRRHGLRGATARLRQLQAIVDAIEARIGERDAHLVIGWASLWNGCRFCALGHVHAANLAHFRDTGELFPLDEDDLARRLHTDSDAQLLAHLRAALGERHPATLARLERLYQLKAGHVPHPALVPDAPPTHDRDDDVLALAITTYDWLNPYSLAADEGPPELIALSPLQRDRDLRRRHATARAAARV